MDLKISKKAARRRRQRLKRKGLSAENISEENQFEEISKEGKEEEKQGNMNKVNEKSKEQILAERQAKKTAKMQGKKKDNAIVSSPKNEVKLVATTAPSPNKTAEQNSSHSTTSKEVNRQETEKSRDQVHSEREARKLAKQAAKKKGENLNQEKEKNPIMKTNSDVELAVKMENLHIADDTINLETSLTKAKPATKAERRAIQEAQRAAKTKLVEDKKAIVSKPKAVVESPKVSTKPTPAVAVTKSGSITIAKSTAVHKVKLFKHLYADKCDLNIKVNQQLHPAIIKLGLQYANDLIVGSNARCYAFLNAMKTLVNDYETPQEKVFSRGLEAELQPAVEFLQNCRPFAVSMTNALKYIKMLVSLEDSDTSDDDKKQRLIEKIDTYAKEQIETAAIAISLKVREKISNGDVILIYGCSSLIKRTLVEAYRDSEIKFRVIIVDSRPDHEGQEMLKSLAVLGINCTYVFINSISFIMPEVTKVLLGAHALLANGYVMSRVGTAQIALVANSYNVPVLVCCETHKFSERVQTDAFVFNELGDPNALVTNKNTREISEHLKDWETIPYLTPLNLRYDITPPELVTAVVTEVAILPCTSVQVILRVKPAE
ncbi:CLUMA_CG021411, isoform A [Clunio marinus]|uniref:Translation initiation factor eIF2B subunit delta n=1 Tax=Clunio marinus TaxID=568069 RepID=A0A1J1J8E1_9DIPT|nr:CLUMA_CG021411, isoform A [Clunio marinus]